MLNLGFRCANTLIVGLIIVATAGGCGTKYVQVDNNGLHYLRYSYRVPFVSNNPRSVLRGKASWIVDNFHLIGGEWVLNTGNRYQATARIDRDGDGVYEKETAYLFDLKLNHRASNAVIWIQNQELSVKSSGKSLEVLLSNYASSLTGTGFYAESNVFSVLTVKQKRYVAVIKQRGYIVVAGRQALQARIQVLNIDQRRIQRNHQGNTILVTVLKTPYKYASSSGEIRSGQTVMIIGYFNSTPKFAALRSDYELLRSQIRFSPIPGMPVPRLVVRPVLRRRAPVRAVPTPPRTKTPPRDKGSVPARPEPRRAPPRGDTEVPPAD